MEILGTLQQRVRKLIDDRFLGSVNAAAKSWGVAQPTLRRIAEGITVHPRADVLARIARATETTVEWLLTGSGEGPVGLTSAGQNALPVLESVAAWRRLVIEVGLLEEMTAAEREQLEEGRGASYGDFNAGKPLLIAWLLQRSLLDLPGAPYFLGVDIAPPLRGPAGEEWPMTVLHDAALAALDASAKAWTSLLALALEELGAARLRTALRANALEVIFGYSRMSEFLRSHEAAQVPGLLDGYALWLQSEEPDTWLPTREDDTDFAGPPPTD